jgi:hypothetical protein
MFFLVFMTFMCIPEITILIFISSKHTGRF